MFKIIKFFFYIAIFLVITAVGLTFYINFQGKNVIEQVGTQTLGVPVSVGNVNFSPLEGLVEIFQLSISNPEGYQEKEALGVDRVTVDIVPGSLLSSPIHIENILIDNLRTTYEVDSKGKANLQILSDILASGSSSQTSDQNTPAPSQSQDSKIKLVVENFKAQETTLTINLEAVGAKRYVEILPTFTVDGLGGQEGLTPEELGKEIILVTLTNVVKKAQTIYEDKVKTDLKNKIIDGLGDKIKGLMDKF